MAPHTISRNTVDEPDKIVEWLAMAICSPVARFYDLFRRTGPNTAEGALE